jgi:hypothetical protein
MAAYRAQCGEDSYRTANAAVDIVEINYERGDEVDQFIGDLVKTAQEAGIKSQDGYACCRDNHIVFEVKGGMNDLPFWIHISDWKLHISTRCEVGRW